MRTSALTLVTVLIGATIGVLSFDGTALAHRSGCHRWHTCPSDTGSYEMETDADGDAVPFCGDSMYRGTDGKCHYFSTDLPGSTDSKPSAPTPKPSTERKVETPAAVSCGKNMHLTGDACVCNLGFKKSGAACVFSACPSRLVLNAAGDACISPVKEPEVGEVRCLSLRPCKCPTGYKAKGNRTCVRN